jgi:hypothetical protein
MRDITKPSENLKFRTDYKRVTLKFPSKYRNYLFALIMSSVTGFIVSGIISLLHHATIFEWLKAFLIAWPMVFLSIVTIAPRISQFIDGFVEKS